MSRIRTIAQVVEEFHASDPSSAINYHFIKTLVNNGELKCFRAGNKILLDLDEVINYFDSNKKKS